MLPAPTIFRSLTRPTINKFGLPHKISVLCFGTTVIITMWVFRRIGYLLVFMLIEYVVLSALVEWDPNFWRICVLWWRTKFKTRRDTMQLWGGSYLAALPCGIEKDAKDVAGAI